MKKKPKLKPSSNVAKVLNLMKADDKTSVKEIVAQTGIKPQNVYAIRNHIKKRGLMKGSLPMTGIAPNLDTPQGNVQKMPKIVQKTISKLSNDLEIKTQQVNGLSAELNRVRHMYMDQLAIVRYLETKLMQFVEAQNTGRNQ